MERQKHSQLISRQNLVISFFIILFHAVGLFGFLNSSLNERFIGLVPFHLLLMFLLMLISQREWNRDFLLFIAITYLGGYGIEYLGVHTGLLFGTYHYGQTLGFKIAEIPLLIGLNWVLLIYSVGVTVRLLPLKSSWLKAGIAAAVLVVLDMLIEPMAIRFDYWDWENGIIPLQNYFAWFVVSFAGYLFFNRMKFDKENPAGIVLLLAQFLFFIILNVGSA